MSKSLEEFLDLIPEEYRSKIILLEKFKGNRTNISFTFSCECSVNQSLKAFLTRDNFQYCTKCKNKYCEKFICEICLTEFVRKDMFEACLSKCKEKYSKLIEGEDFVICKICNFRGQNLGIHVKKIHNISPDDYKKQYNCKTTSEKSFKKYSENTHNYIKDAQEKGIDLTEYWEKVSKGVRAAILSNPEERKRRSESMIKLNKIQQNDPAFQKLISDTAKITSSKPDVILNRTKQLAQWRKDHPEDFYNKCITKMLSSWHSTPEKELFNIVSKMAGFNFKYNQIIESPTFISKSKRKQIDIADKNKQIYIEYDGIFHFKQKFRDDLSFKECKEKDNLLNQYILNNNYLLIRISYDQFIYKTKVVDKIKQDVSYFKQECLDKIIEILSNKIPGVYKIGDAYGKY